MNKAIVKNLANIITFIRITMIFIVIWCLSYTHPAWRMWGFLTLIFAFLFDGLDGLVAKKMNTHNNIGSLIDTLGDRITENVMLVFLAYKRLIPLFIPIVFISRSFIADFIRFIFFSKGIGTFSINKSKLGFNIVASNASRVLYLLLKFIVFLLGAFIIVYPEREIFYGFSSRLLLFNLALILTIINVLRFLGLAFDSKKMLKEIFIEG